MINRLTLNLRSRLVPSMGVTTSYAQNSAPFWTFSRHQGRGGLSDIGFEEPVEANRNVAESPGRLEGGEGVVTVSEMIELDSVPPSPNMNMEEILTVSEGNFARHDGVVCTDCVAI